MLNLRRLSNRPLFQHANQIAVFATASVLLANPSFADEQPSAAAPTDAPISINPNLIELQSSSAEKAGSDQVIVQPEETTRTVDWPQAVTGYYTRRAITITPVKPKPPGQVRVNPLFVPKPKTENARTDQQSLGRESAGAALQQSPVGVLAKESGTGGEKQSTMPNVAKTKLGRLPEVIPPHLEHAKVADAKAKLKPRRLPPLKKQKDFEIQDLADSAVESIGLHLPGEKTSDSSSKSTVKVDSVAQSGTSNQQPNHFALPDDFQAGSAFPAPPHTTPTSTTPNQSESRDFGALLKETGPAQTAVTASQPETGQELDRLPLLPSPSATGASAIEEQPGQRITQTKTRAEQALATSKKPAFGQRLAKWAKSLGGGQRSSSEVTVTVEQSDAKQLGIANDQVKSSTSNLGATQSTPKVSGGILGRLFR